LIDRISLSWVYWLVVPADFAKIVAKSINTAIMPAKINHQDRQNGV
jgi:hypothetical protein